MSAPAAEAPPRSTRRRAHPAVVASAIDALVVLVWFVVAGILGAVAWWQLVTLPKVTKTAEGASLSPEQLVKQVGIDGWFFVIAVIGGLLSSVILLSWRRRDPLVMVVLVVLGGGLASWLMVHLGHALGPEKELTALRDVPQGGQVSMTLALQAKGMVWIWSIGAALGALVQLWVLRKQDPDPASVDTLR
jgi:hypothetical protein